MSRRSRTLLLATTALAPLAVHPALANPVGAQVVGGAATVQGQGTAAVTVKEQTNSAIIDWRQFNIGVNESTTFVQPNASSVVLNRVTGDTGPSQILGTLKSNGEVFLVNPDGLLFGPGAKINTGSFLATTNDASNADFMAGRYNFTIPGKPSASIVNEGSITARNGGFAALVAPGVRNDGIITATLGTVGLAAGNGFTLDFYGDKLITLGVSDSIASQVIDVATGQPLDSLVKNAGKLKADGGRVELTASSARQVVDSVINNTGIIEANTIGTRKGMIVLGAATAGSKPAGAPTQVVKVSGTLSAAGKKKGAKGGAIVVTGESVQLASATLDASGLAGGGKVLVGGDVGGGKLNPAVAGIPEAALEAFAVPNATNVSVDAGSTINVSAIDSGNGGKVVVWSDTDTVFRGAVLGSGGLQGGNGGFAEISGRVSVDFAGMTADLGAPKGNAGTILYDPDNIFIGAAMASTLESELNQGQAVVVAAAGNVEVGSNILKTAGGDATLLLIAAWALAPTGSTITFDPNVVLGSSSGKLNLGLVAFSGLPFTEEMYVPGFSTSYFGGSLSQYVSAAEAAGAITPATANAFFGAHIDYNNAKFYLNGGEFVGAVSNGVAETNGGFLSYAQTHPPGDAEDIGPYLQQFGYNQLSDASLIIDPLGVRGFAAIFGDLPPAGVVSYGALSAAVPSDIYSNGQTSWFTPVNTQTAQSTEPVISNLPGAVTTTPADTSAGTLSAVTVDMLPSPPTYSTTLNQVKGTFKFTMSNQTQITLNSQYNGVNEGTQDGPNQCTDLIASYVNQALGVTALTNETVKDGSGVALQVANVAPATFKYVAADNVTNAANLPEVGSVISFSGWGLNQPDGDSAGHVAVVQQMVKTSAGYTATLFDQNLSTNGTGIWKQVYFTYANGKWTGTMQITSSLGNVYNVAADGWATPF